MTRFFKRTLFCLPVGAIILPLSFYASLMTGAITVCGTSTPNPILLLLIPALPGVLMASSEDQAFALGWLFGTVVYALCIAGLAELYSYLSIKRNTKKNGA